jgi:5-methylcytosine-specific restriction endonuclease McrA
MSADMTIAHALCAAQGGRCFYCGQDFKGRQKNRFGSAKSWTRDHIRAASKGHKRLGNIVLACGGCNTRKGDREPTQEEIGRADAVQREALRIITAFNGLAPAEWVSALNDLSGVAP